MIFQDFLKALEQLPDPRFRRVLFLGLGLTVALLVGAYAIVLGLINLLTGETTTLPGGYEVTWLGDLLSLGSLVLMLVLSVFLMIPVASAITSLFLDDVAAAVEKVHYPHARPVGRVPFFDGLRDSVNFLGVIVGANILALVLYIPLFFIPFAPLILFYALNGYLLGREYFIVAAMRREGRIGAAEMRKAHKGEVWLAGCLMAVPLTVPLLNLFIPIVGAATFTHIYHRLARQD
ncbi:EI24 domain-containing protein [Yoonia sp. R2331]|uniref:EI24 domain-containing protein n=1 Tax=Yoonia sp. R2331 TaxID=3237238 RepID=UPI0034E3DE27